MRLILSTFLVFIFISTSAKSQSYKPFEWDIIRLGVVFPTGDGTSTGGSIGTEPRYNINDNFSASLRLEAAIFGSEDDAFDLGTSGSWTLFGDYYFQNNKNKRAFAGLGIGFFSGADLTVETNGNTSTVAEGGNGVGLVPRVGYELGFLRISAEYDLAFSSDISNYIGVNLGFTILGRARR